MSDRVELQLAKLEKECAQLCDTLDGARYHIASLRNERDELIERRNKWTSDVIWGADWIYSPLDGLDPGVAKICNLLRRYGAGWRAVGVALMLLEDIKRCAAEQTTKTGDAQP